MKARPGSKPQPATRKVATKREAAWLVEKRLLHARTHHDSGKGSGHEEEKPGWYLDHM